jgi:predicted glycosyltransferase
VDVPEQLVSRARFVGNIVRLPAPDSSRRTGSDKQLIITGGGGGFPKTVEFYNLAIESYARCRRKDPHLNCVLIVGPLFSDWWDLRVTDGVRLIPSEPQLRELLTDADLVICQGGYNTVSEITQLHLPCVCIPAPRGFDDQFARAHQAAKSRPNFHVYEGNDPDVLAALMESCLASPRSTSQGSSSMTDGGDQAAALLLDYVAHGRRSQGRRSSPQ